MSALTLTPMYEHFDSDPWDDFKWEIAERWRIFKEWVGRKKHRLLNLLKTLYEKSTKKK